MKDEKNTFIFFQKFGVTQHRLYSHKTKCCVERKLSHEKGLKHYSLKKKLLHFFHIKFICNLCSSFRISIKKHFSPLFLLLINRQRDLKIPVAWFNYLVSSVCQCWKNVLCPQKQSQKSFSPLIKKNKLKKKSKGKPQKKRN